MTVAPQHMQALAKANQIRLRRVAVRRDIASGAISPIELLEGEIPPELEAMTLGKLLGSMRQWGPARVNRLLGYCSLSEKRTIGSLNERQRRLLALELRRVHGNTNNKAA